MKKKLLLASMLAFTCFSLFAQPVLNAGNTNPVVGDMFVLKTAMGPANPGNSGANQTWDLSTLTFSTSTNYSGVTTTGTPIPSASVKMVAAGIGDYYYSATSSALEIVGAYTPSGGLITYTDNEKLLSYPFQMGNNFVDPFACSYTNGMTFYRSGTDSVSADGYGTLILPNGTYTNVLRVKTVQHYHDSVTGVGILFQYDNTSYNWYKPGNRYPIAGVHNLFMNGSSVAEYALYMESIVSGIKDVDNNTLASITIYPNPCADHISIHMSDKSDQSISFQLTDLTGKQLSIVTSKITPTDFQIVPTQKASGIYLLHIIKEGKLVGSKKVEFVD